MDVRDSHGGVRAGGRKGGAADTFANLGCDGRGAGELVRYQMRVACDRYCSGGKDGACMRESENGFSG